MKCKFCGCTDETPCRIPIDVDGNLSCCVTGLFTVCGWMIENVCNAPSCVKRAYDEAEMLASQIEFWMQRSA